MTINQIRKPNSYMLIQAAKELGIAIKLKDEEKLSLKLSYQGKTHTVTKKSLGINTTEAIRLSHDKYQTTSLLKKNGMKIPQEVLIHTQADLDVTIIPPFPVVVKPLSGQKGADVFMGIKDQEQLKTLVKNLVEEYDGILIQELIQGINYRFTLLGDKIVGISQRLPQEITGDGVRTVKQLIQDHNQKTQHTNKSRDLHMQNPIKLKDTTVWHIKNQGYELSQVLPKGEQMTPTPVANFQTGGWVKTISISEIHQSILKQILKVHKLVGLTISGIDVIIGDHTKPAQDNVTYIEINSDPSLRLHDRPNQGSSQKTNQALLKYIFDLT